MPIELTKERPSVNLSKQSSAVVEIILSWTTKTDVDLACLYELANGDKGCVQALGKNFGSLNSAPFVELSGDDRSGGSETLQVNLGEAAKIKRLIPFAYIYQGGDWKKVGDAKVTIRNSNGDEWLVRLSGVHAKSCTLVDLQNDGAGGLNLTRLEHYFNGVHEEIDRHYSWPRLNWVKGSKD